MAGLSTYEQQRLDNIAANQSVLSSLGLSGSSGTLAQKKRKEYKAPTCKVRDNSRESRVLRPRLAPVAANTGGDEGTQFDEDGVDAGVDAGAEMMEEDLEEESEDGVDAGPEMMEEDLEDESGADESGAEESGAEETEEETEEESEEEMEEESADSRQREEEMVEEEMERARKREEERDDARKREEEAEASLPGGQKVRPSHLRRDKRLAHILSQSRLEVAAVDLKDAEKLAIAACMLPAKVESVIVALGDDDMFAWSSTLSDPDRVALKCTCKLLELLIPARVGLAAKDRVAISEMLDELKPNIQLSQALLSKCCGDQVLDSLRDGAREAGVPLAHRGRATLERMLSPEESRQKVASLLHDVCSELGPGLIPLGREGAIVEQLLRAHAEGRMLFTYKDGIPCADIYDLTKFANNPNFVDLDEVFQRILVLIGAGTSVSSGGGSRVNGTRVHIRQPREGCGSTPGSRSHHLDSVGDKDVPDWVWTLWNQDRRNRYASSTHPTHTEPPPDLCPFPNPNPPVTRTPLCVTWLP